MRRMALVLATVGALAAVVLGTPAQANDGWAGTSWRQDAWRDHHWREQRHWHVARLGDGRIIARLHH